MRIHSWLPHGALNGSNGWTHNLEAPEFANDTAFCGLQHNQLDGHMDYRYDISLGMRFAEDSLRYVSVLAIAVAILLTAKPANSCEWARGYFYQVTQLRGRVVGAKLGPLQYAGWLRQSRVREHVELTLYTYRAPIKARSDMPLVKKSVTDAKGNFDFGLLNQGHYTLIVDDLRWGSSDWFDIEIASLTRQRIR